MGLSFCFCTRSSKNILIWRTQHQPIVEVSEVDLVIADEAVVAVEIAVAEDVVAVVEDVEKKRKNGSPSPNLVASSKIARSRVWRKFTFSPFPSKSTKSSISS